MSSQSNLYTIVIAIIVLAIIGGALYLFGNTAQTDQNEVTDVSENNSENNTGAAADNNTDTDENVDTVTYTDDGFSPETIAISQGDTVRFVNESANPMWVASNEHPTHTLYSGTSRSQHCNNGGADTAFDQCNAGETFTFTFENVGTWDYHNHLFPTDQGSVIVE